ncbi:MAG: hypothetical protein JWM57_2091, partial [Phycisphaerales bacterium]|nr:hypothetical protein [Phycisphaerales bacterium]
MRRFILTALLLTASVALAADPATKPATFTNHDVVNARIALGRHTLLDTYNTDGVHSPQWDDKAKAFLELMAQRFGDANEDSTYCTDVDTSLSTMVPLADALGKCGDPLVNYCRAIIYKDSGDSEAYTATINRWAPKVVAGKYPALRRYYAAAALARLSPRNAELAKQRDDLFLPMLLMPLPDPIDRRLMVAYAVDNWDNMQTPAGQKSVPRGALIDQLEAQKGDPWIIAVLRGTNAITAAWESRGNGFANTVTPAGWAGFGKSIALARQNFQAAYGMEPTYPEAASGMITVCMAESGQADDPRVWFDRAIGAQIDYMNAWSGYAQVLQPRWGGSLPAMMALASEAAATKRYDTIVPFYAATVLLMMTKENQAGDTVYRRRGVWDILLNVYDGYLDPPAKNINVQWVASYRAVFAWKCGQFAEALRTLIILGEQVN